MTLGANVVDQCWENHPQQNAPLAVTQLVLLPKFGITGLPVKAWIEANVIRLNLCHLFYQLEPGEENC